MSWERVQKKNDLVDEHSDILASLPVHLKLLSKIGALVTPKYPSLNGTGTIRKEKRKRRERERERERERRERERKRREREREREREKRKREKEKRKGERERRHIPLANLPYSGIY